MPSTQQPTTTTTQPLGPTLKPAAPGKYSYSTLVTAEGSTTGHNFVRTYFTPKQVDGETRQKAVDYADSVDYFSAERGLSVREETTYLYGTTGAGSDVKEITELLALDPAPPT